jgi:hypothetical protein
MLFQVQVAPAERPGVVAAAELLSESLVAASGRERWPVRIQFHPAGEQIAPAAGVSAIVLSLLPEAERPDEPIAATEARWRAQLDPLLASGAPVFLRTVFRHAPERARDGTPTPVLERIRRLNRMAADLSHALGVGVIDIDRSFAHIGGRILQTDWRMGGVLASEVAGHTMAWSLLSFGLDDAVDPALQEKAREALGGLSQIDAVVSRRLSRRHAAQAARG